MQRRPQNQNSEHEKVKTENFWLEIVKSIGEKFVVSVIYRHPNGNVRNFSEKLEHSLDTLNHDRTITHKIVTGDFNIDLIKFNHHTTTGEYLEMLPKNSFLPTIFLPNRVTSHTCTLIDRIYFSTSKTRRDQFMSGNLLTDMSNHFANFFVLYSNKRNKKENKPMARLFSEKNEQNFQNIFKQINWKKELSGKTTDEAMQIVYKELSIAYNKAFPYVRLSRKRASDKPLILH